MTKYNVGISIIIIFLLAMFIFNIGQTNNVNAVENEDYQNSVKNAQEEFRGIWVTTVWGLDYPSKATTDDEILKRDAVEILENIKEMGFNAVFLQVRSNADAIYDSDIFPWSRFLTGKQGLAPKNNFDPLQFFIEEAHKRGLEVHAWINPYRITGQPSDNDKLALNNPAVLYPELTVLHTDGKLYFNPGEPNARKLIVDGVKEILDHYDIDGIHLDDYFYPDKNFNDTKTYYKYGKKFSNINEWRRNNINLLIQELSEEVHSKDPELKFGVSPIGIWTNKTTNSLGSDTYGWESYTNQFADTRLWVKKEYIDYIMPQLYWNIGYKAADYKVLVDWWINVVTDTNVELYIGQAAYRTVGAESNNIWYGTDEIKRQIELNRMNDSVRGYCMFRYKSFLENYDLYKMIKQYNSPFIDIIDHPLENYIKFMAQKNIILGYNGRFNPSNNIKRADFVVMLMRMFEIDNIIGANNFADVDEDSYYYNELATAKEIGLIFGMGNDMFAPEKEVTRQDIFVMTNRALETLKKSNEAVDNNVLKKYSDYHKISDYAVYAISYFTQKNILTGDNNNIKPVNAANRAETATFLAKVLQSDILNNID